MTKLAPNPGPERVGGGRPMPGSRPPLNVAVIDALRPILDPEDWHQTPLWHLVVAQRAARDELHAAGVPDAELPTPAEFPTYASEAGWLLATMDEWQAMADEFAYRFIEQGVNDCYSELARLAREPKLVVLRCPLCTDVLRAQAGDWLRCDSGHEYPGAARLLAEAWPTGYVVAQFKITEDRLRKWHERGKIQPLKEGVKPLYWRPLDVLQALETDGRTG